MREWQREQCSVRPKELERVNPDTFIQRRNIKSYEREVHDGQMESGYTCESRFLSIEEYCGLQEENARQEAMKGDILTSMAGQADIYENQLLIMSGMADLYEEIEAIKAGKGGV